MRLILLITSVLALAQTDAQTLGGSAAYTFLSLPSTPLLSASGGVNTSYYSNDIGLALNNPALIKPELHTDVSLSFNNYFAGIKAFNLSGGYYKEKVQTTFGANIFFIDYGKVQQTDASGNISGDFHPVDYAIQISASRMYLEKWYYGLSAKFINSKYQQYSSNALAFDVGVLYIDSVNNLTASVLAKNIGVQLKSYTQQKEDLPFDLEAGVTKKLEKAPFAFSLTAHHLHHFNIIYNDTTFNDENNFTFHNSFLNKLFSHLVFAAHIYAGSNLEATIGYNVLRRQELNIGSGGNGLNGFSTGMLAKFKKLQFQYARSYFQRNVAYNQFAVAITLNQLFGIEGL
ncbi:MAG: type IX secretion system protein PorQ [Chitinophagaceae bacterium]|nr:type IX secretion system protein PorQ [Chitinophagaceae bacterium]